MIEKSRLNDRKEMHRANSDGGLNAHRNVRFGCKPRFALGWTEFWPNPNEKRGQRAKTGQTRGAEELIKPPYGQMVRSD